MGGPSPLTPTMWPGLDTHLPQGEKKITVGLLAPLIHLLYQSCHLTLKSWAHLWDPLWLTDCHSCFLDTLWPWLGILEAPMTLTWLGCPG